MSTKSDHISNVITQPLLSTSRRYYILIGILSIPVIIAFIAWIDQLRNGLGVTGLNHRVFWGIYIANFIFFIGISYSGTLISAVLRLTGSDWRTPLTRMAESITVIGIAIGFAMVLIDMGRPDRVLLVPFALRLSSPLFWDMLSVSTYLTGSLIYFLMPLIPDMAILRDKFRDTNDPRKHIYRILSFGWTGTEKQELYLEKSISVISVILIPIAIMCHTVIAFIFAMTWRVGWHSTIFGPYFVVAAVFSGTGAIILAMAVVRKVYNFEEFITEKHFRNLGLLLFTLLATYFYFTVTEYFTTSYRGAVPDVELLEELFFASYAIYFWLFIIFGMIIPGLMIIIGIWKYEGENLIKMITGASFLVVVGMWLKRYIIIVPALARPFVETTWTLYNPTWVEIWITLGGLTGFMLIFALVIKIFPIISIWETSRHEEEKEANLKKQFEEMSVSKTA